MREDVNRNLRPASCCSVEVVNGARGRSVNGSESTLATRKGTSRNRSASAVAPAASSRTTSRSAREAAGRGVEVAAFGDPSIVHVDQRGAERLRVRVGVRGEERALEVVPLPGAERHARPLALHDHPHRDALDTARGRGLPAPEHTPQDRRRLPPDEPVEDAPGLLRLDELHVEVTWMFERLADRVRRDLVEHHPLHRDLRVEHLEHVPPDGLALAVLVGREDELVGALQRALQLGDDLLLGRVHDVHDVEVVVRVDAGQAAVGLDLLRALGLQLLLVARQVADVPDARHHRVIIRAEVARDGLAFGG